MSVWSQKRARCHGSPLLRIRDLADSRAAGRPLDDSRSAVASAEVVGSSTRRQPYHRTASAELSDVQTPTGRTHRRVRHRKCDHERAPRRISLERSRRPYMTSASAEAVGSWIRRLPHYRTTPCELWDAQSTARRPHRRVWSVGSTAKFALERRIERSF